MHRAALETTDIYCNKIYDKLSEFKDNTITKEEVEYFYLYVLSIHTSIENLSHKVTKKTALVLQELVNHIYQELSKTADEVVRLDTDQIMPPAIRQRLQATIQEVKQTIFSLFWTRGATWTDIDSHIAVEVRQDTCG